LTIQIWDHLVFPTEDPGGSAAAQTQSLGVAYAKRVMDEFCVETSNGQTQVRLTKQIPNLNGASPADWRAIQDALAGECSQDPVQEMQRHNEELIGTLTELQKRQQEILQLNRELEETNRGVVALYAELDERADYLRKASELKSRFLSNMTHEFRTPLNSILSLSRLLLDKVDGDLNAEQEKQVDFIRKAAKDLSDLVNDLLDLAKVEAGKEVVNASTFLVEDLFSVLRGTTKPLLPPNALLALTFQEMGNLPPIKTDERKLSQILRNFISNAIKYTEHGEIRVTAVQQNPREIIFSVSDTGIGIAPEDQEKVFEEFVQIDNAAQRRAKGTGLGLPLARSLAELLGGRVSLQSQPGKGSTFSLTLPVEYSGSTEVVELPEIRRRKEPGRIPILAVDDNNETLLLYENHLQGTRFQLIPAQSIREARESIKVFRPAAILLDILLGTENSWELLDELRRDPLTRHLPVYVLSVVKNGQKAMALGATDFQAKPVSREWLLDKMEQVMSSRPKEVLIIDDDEISRYLLKGMLAAHPVSVLEAGGGNAGIAMAREIRPALIFLDITMPEVDGFEVLESLKKDSQTREIPVVIYTSKILTEDERRRVESGALTVLSKSEGERENTVVEIQNILGQTPRN
jgi:signal transduction histidine kinase/CheY-like chemotaxis protein